MDGLMFAVQKTTLQKTTIKTNLVKGDNRMVASEAEQGVTGSGSRESMYH